MITLVSVLLLQFTWADCLKLSLSDQKVKFDRGLPGKCEDNLLNNEYLCCSILRKWNIG